jgi:hypothetical protein
MENDKWKMILLGRALLRQRFPRDFLIVKVKDFAAKDLIVLVTLARN